MPSHAAVNSRKPRFLPRRGPPNGFGIDASLRWVVRVETASPASRRPCRTRRISPTVSPDSSATIRTLD